jgi:hypothetical protein
MSDPAFPCRWSLLSGNLHNSNVLHSDFCVVTWLWSIAFSIQLSLWFYAQTKPLCVWRLILTSISLLKVALVPSCNGHSCHSVYRTKACKYSLEMEKDVYTFGIQGFLSFCQSFCTGMIQGGQEQVFLFWGGLVNYKAYYGLSWFRPLLGGNSPMSSSLILKMDSGYNGVSKELKKFMMWRGKWSRTPYPGGLK